MNINQFRFLSDSNIIFRVKSDTKLTKLKGRFLPLMQY